MASEAGVLLSHQVDILYDFNPTPICTGTILSSYLILTAASCLANKRILKLTVQTQNPPESGSESPPQPSSPPEPTSSQADFDYEAYDKQQQNKTKYVVEEEDEGIKTRYVDSFYPIKAWGPNETFKREHQLAIIVLDKKLKWSGSVTKAQLLTPAGKHPKFLQPYKCFESGSVNAQWPTEIHLEETDFSNCQSIDEDFLESPIFPPGCLADTPKSSDSGLVCPAPLPGSGLFCQQTTQHAHSDLDYPDDGKEKKLDQVLCGILSLDSDGGRPVYINISQYLHGILLPEEEEDDVKGLTAEEEELYKDVAATSIGGEKVDYKFESFPYQLSLEEYIKGHFEHHCGAVLLDNRTALTAAHCFSPGKKLHHYRLVAGMRQVDEVNPNNQTLNLTRFLFHDKWDGSFMKGYDIALLTVKGSFVLDNDTVRPVWISSQDEPVLSDFTGTATGWGKFKNSGPVTKNLMKVDLPLLPFERCKGILHFFKDGMICARTGYSNVCGGDSGGPLVLKNYEVREDEKRDLLVGITSYAAKDCENLKQPSVFTKVSSVYDWINLNWKRNPKTPNKFTCFNGEEIEADWRCDEELDCADGSDEKGCTIKPTKVEEIPKTRQCGGKIEMKTEEYDIIYRVEDSESGKLSQCVWTIFNAKKNPIELTLLENIDAVFDPAQNQLIALHNFTLENFNTESITTIDKKVKILDSYTTVIFRGPVGIQDSGFHLRLKSVGKSAVNNPFRFTRSNLKPNSTLQTHAYPSNGVYEKNERVFIVLAPVEKGGRIKLNVTFGAMENVIGRDWFDIISIGKEAKSLFRLCGIRKDMNEPVEGGRDEILLVFMSTGNVGTRRKGIKFTYFEDQPKLNPTPGLSCGGNLTVDGDQDLVYQANRFNSSCVWVISNSRAGSSSLTLLNRRSHLFNLTDGSSSLYILHNFSRHDSHSQHINQFHQRYLVDQPFFVLYFRSSPFSTTTGFFLKLRHLNSTSDSNSSSSVAQEQNLQRFDSILTPSSSRTQEFSYPVTTSQNSNSNSEGGALILIQPKRNDRTVHLNLKNIQLTDVNEEWLEILTFRQRPVSIYRTSRSRNMMDKSFVSSEGEPFVIFIKSNSDSNSDGEKKSLTFSYFEKKENATRTQSCGSVIHLGRRHEISYKAPPGQRSDCLWAVHNAHGPHSNITVTSLDTTNSQLILVQDNKTTNLMRDERIKTESSVVALLFRSNGNENTETLTVNLKGVSDFGSGSGEDSLDVRVISLEAKSQRVEKIAHPPPPALTYENNERLFILITPEENAEAGAGAVNKIQLNLTFIDLEPVVTGVEIGDRLELYSFAQNPNGQADRTFKRVVEFESFDYWTNNTFTGEANEPFLLYFHSDSSTVKSGFNFNYRNIRSIGA